MEPIVLEQASDIQLKLYAPSIMQISRIQTREVTSRRAVVTLCRISTEELAFETDLRFPIHEGITCRFLLPLAGEFTLDATLVHASERNGMYRYLAKPQIGENGKQLLLRAIHEEAQRIEMSYMTARHAYAAPDEWPRSYLSNRFDQTV